MTRWEQARLDEEHVAARLGPCHARRHAGPRNAERDLATKAGRSKILVKVIGTDDILARLGLGWTFDCHDARRDLPGDGANLPLEAAHAGFARVIRDDSPKRFVLDDDSRGLEPVLVQLARNQVAPGDVHLFLFAVAGQRENLHAIEEGGVNRPELIGRRDEEHP